MHRICPLLFAAAALAGIAQAGDQPAAAPSPAVPSAVSASDDPYLWLEDIHGAKPMEWVKAHNAITSKRFMDSSEFARTRDRILEVMDSDARIPYTTRRDNYLYNFWQDKANPRGVWRRTTLEEYRKADPAWETLIDIDALNKAENAKWVFKGVDCLRPANRRCLVSLSPGGGDKVEVREFDVVDKSFVKDGFRIPLAKSNESWIDQDSLYVATDFGPGSMTDSGYARITKIWKRGTPLSSATTVYAGKSSDVQVGAERDNTPGFERDWVSVATDYFHSNLYQLKDGKLIHVDVPTDSSADPHHEWLLIKPRSPWTVGATTYPAGSLIATKFDDFMTGKREFAVLFRPDAHTALTSFTWTQHHLILNELDDVKSRLEVLTPQQGDWKREPMAGAPALSAVEIVDTDPDHGDEYWTYSAGHLTPDTLQRGVLGESAAETIKSAPAFFDASKSEVSQHFATSKDGTRVPYFEIDPKGMKFDGSNITLLYGYGGFEDSQLPYYSGTVGRSWMERGGVYVVANIRGGGEYGPAWHTAATRANRHKGFEDFAAVAQDLIARGVTSPRHLGAEGGSNGGLLVGNMLTQYPELFSAIACEVPLLDMKRYSHLSAGASWLAEYGDPDTADWNYLKTISPYQNVRANVKYPPILFYTTTSDDRVGPAQARKMAAKMEGMKLPGVWFYENSEGGHGAGADNQQAATMYALTYTFLWDRLE